MTNKKTVFYIDPQSYANLAVYDHSLLSNNKELCITFWGSYLYDYKQHTNYDFVPVFRYNKKRTIFKLISYFFSLLKIFIAILKQKPDIIHIQWIKIWSVDYCFLKLVKLLTSSKVIYTAHNLLPHDSENQHDKYILYYKTVDSIIVHVESSKKELIKKFGINSSKINVIPHGVLDFDIDENLVETYREELHRKIGFKNQLVFATLGNQSLYKGSDLIARVWKDNEFLHNDEAYKLIILGKNNQIDFSEINQIKNVYIEDRYLTNEEFIGALRCSDIILLPYRTISQSGVLLSCINECVPVIVSNTGGLGEIIEQFPIGWNMGESNINNLQKSILETSQLQSRVKNLKHDINLWKLAKEFYSWDSISLKTFELYKNIN